MSNKDLYPNGQIPENLNLYPQVVKAFSQGINEETPSPHTLQTANQIIKASTEETVEFDFYVDDSDGALGFMLRLKNALIMLAELSTQGKLSGGTYTDDKDKARQVNFLNNVTVNQLTALFQPRRPPTPEQTN